MAFLPMFCIESGCPRRTVEHIGLSFEDRHRYIYGDPRRCVYHQPRARKPRGCGRVLVSGACNTVTCRGANLCVGCGSEIVPEIDTMRLPDDPPRDRLWLIRHDA